VPDYTAISIIYNPKSTGASKANAFALVKELRHTPVADRVRITPTFFPGHAETLAYDLAKASQRPLIVSSSGDGGYNEVINGVLRAQAEGAIPTCGLLPSGNANDHYHNLHKKPIVEQILGGEQLQIDILRANSYINGHPWQRYAHSYIGLGLTPRIGLELNKVDLNRWREAWIVVRTLYKLRTCRLIIRGQERRFDSLIFSNVNRMSKILSLSDTAELTDGKFEIISFPTHSKFYLFSQLLKAATIGLRTTRHADHYNFTTVRPTRIQLDGEIFQLDGGAATAISLEPQQLRCII
jgi:diacylglycerol kinase (ATP)